MRSVKLANHISGIRSRLGEIFKEHHSPREIAGSFALGTFVTMLPTFGIGLVLFAIIAYLFDWVSKLALLATVVIFNPIVKWGIYVASYGLGSFILSTGAEVGVSRLAVTSSREIVIRLLVGNLILAPVGALIGYVVVYRLAVRYESSVVAEAIDEVLDEIVHEVLEP